MKQHAHERDGAVHQQEYERHGVRTHSLGTHLTRRERLALGETYTREARTGSLLAAVGMTPDGRALDDTPQAARKGDLRLCTPS